MNPMRILLIEDSPSDALLVETFLAGEKSFPHTISHAERLQGGLAFMVDKVFDVVLSDLGLPDSQGLATFEELHKAAPQLPIIVLTRQGDMDTALAAIHKGAQDFLPKSELSGFILSRTIHYAIERKRHETEREKLVAELKATLAEVKTLSGLLPICSGCKQIRDDKGYWNQIETYIKQHTGAQFTHGFCPKCAIKFYEEGGIPVSDKLRTAAENPGMKFS